MSRGQRDSEGDAGKDTPWWRWVPARALALLAAVGAVLGVAFNVDSLGNLVTDRAQKREVYQDLLATIDRQVVDETYDLAFAGVEQAMAQRLASGWKLRGLASLDELEAKQADVAMAWLRGARRSESDPSFSELVARLQPPLQREASRAVAARKADLVAHLGYADYLRSRDGRGGLDPAKHYREALALDSANPFAHAMLGHWILSGGRGAFADAEQAFAAAVDSGRERAMVRHFQLAAYTNRRSSEAFLRVLGEMHAGNEPIDAAAVRHATGVYYFGASEPAPLLDALPPRPHLELVRWLRGQAPEDKHTDLDYFAALLEERAGDAPAAGARLDALLARLRADEARSGAASTRAPLVEAALARLRSAPAGVSPAAPAPEP
jgi:hypothetical protein